MDIDILLRGDLLFLVRYQMTKLQSLCQTKDGSNLGAEIQMMMTLILKHC